MNLAQAIAVAAAAFALSGDPLGIYVVQAEARLSSLTERAEALAHQGVAAAENYLTEDNGCAVARRQGARRTVHKLPDTLRIHAASRAARL